MKNLSGTKFAESNIVFDVELINPTEYEFINGLCIILYLFFLCAKR